MNRKESMSMEPDLGKPRLESSVAHDNITVNTTSTRTEVPKMFEEKFNLDNYLIVFERLAVAQGWPRDKWVSRLTSQFNSKCQEIFSRIPIESCQDYNAVKLKLLEGYNLGPETYRKAFKLLERTQSENFKDYAVKLDEIFQKWLKGVNCDSFEKLCQLLLLEKFYSSVPKELVALLKDKEIKTLAEAGKLADQCDSYREKIFSNQGSNFAREQTKNYTPQFNFRESRIDSFHAPKRNDFKSSNPQKFKKYSSGKFSNDARSSSVNSYHNRKPWFSSSSASNNYPQKSWRNNSSAAPLRYPNNTFNRFGNKVNFVNSESKHPMRSLSQGNSCRFCRREGHKIETCIFRKMYCNHCQKNGHDTQNCKRGQFNPYNAFVTKKDNYSEELFGREMQHATINKIPVRCLRDTGSSISLIRKDLIPNLELLKEFTVCTTAFNSRHTVQLALIDIITKEGSGKLKVGVVDDLLVDLILGNDAKNLEANTPEFCAAITRSRAKQLEFKLKEIEDNENKPEQLNQNLAKAKPIYAKTELETIPESNEIEITEINSEIKQIPTELVMDDLNDIYKLESLKGATRQEFIDEQQKDPSLARVRKAIGKVNENVHKNRENATHYFTKNNLIFRKFYFGPIDKIGEVSSVKQLVVPLKYRRSILSMGHDDPLASHLGVSKTKSIILRRFFWPGIFKDISQYVLSCEKCQKACKKTKRAKAPMIIMPTATRPWQKIIFDIVGPLEKSRKGHEYILVVIDVHSHFPEAFPLKVIDSKNIANELVKLFTRVGIPILIQHDQASTFISKLMTQLYNLLGIKNIASSTYHPETNALVERLNGTIKKLLKTCLIDRDTRTWDEILPLVLFSIRASKSESTGFSPFELMYGYQIRGPLDIVKELWVEEDKLDPVDLHQYVLDLRTTMRELSKQAVERETTIKARVKDRYDKGSQLIEFVEGDKVFMQLPQRVNSLESSWSGPYEVLGKLGPVTYRILVHDRSKKQRVVHVNMLRKYTPRISCFISTVENEEFENETPASFPASAKRTLTSKDVKINPKLNPMQFEKVKQLLKKFDPIFSDLPGSTDVLRHQIRTINDKPINCAPYPIPQALIPIVQKEIDVALQLGLIEPVFNERNPTAYASPTLVVKKKEPNSYRVVVDYRLLNSISIPQKYLLPNTAHLIDKVSSAKFLSLADLTKGFNNIPICPEDIHKTGFLCLGKHYVCKYLNFGLSGGPSTFQLLIDTVLSGMEKYACAFIDDICIFSDTFDEHLVHLENVFNALQKANLTVSPKKASICMPELIFLGHLVGGARKAVDLEKINILEKIPIPRTKKEVRAFLGFIGFYKSFIKDYSEIAVPLTDLLKKSSNDLIPWSKETNSAFQKLKSALENAPVLIAPNYEKPFFVLIDSSLRAVGAAMCQKENDQLRPILFIGRKFSAAETKLSASERECLGILSVLRKLRYYLIGRRFTLLTDAKCLVYLKNSIGTSSKLTRWNLMLFDFEFDIAHVPGKLFTVPDYLSRYVDYAAEKFESE